MELEHSAIPKLEHWDMLPFFEHSLGTWSDAMPMPMQYRSVTEKRFVKMKQINIQLQFMSLVLTGTRLAWQPRHSSLWMDILVAFLSSRTLFLGPLTYTVCWALDQVKKGWVGSGMQCAEKSARVNRPDFAQVQTNSNLIKQRSNESAFSCTFSSEPSQIFWSDLRGKSSVRSIRWEIKCRSCLRRNKNWMCVQRGAIFVLSSFLDWELGNLFCFQLHLKPLKLVTHFIKITSIPCSTHPGDSSRTFLQFANGQFPIRMF